MTVSDFTRTCCTDASLLTSRTRLTLHAPRASGTNASFFSRYASWTLVAWRAKWPCSSLAANGSGWSRASCDVTAQFSNVLLFVNEYG